MRVSTRVGVVCLAVAGTAAAQPSNPSREYVRLGARVIAIENPPAVAAPTFSPGTSSSGQPIPVSISSAAGTTVQYSLNGAAPITGNSVTINTAGPNTLQAIAYAGTTASPTATAVYTIETVTAPSTPAGSASPVINAAFNYCTGGSTAGQGEAVQYQFDWGDMTNSGWLATGTTCATHAWTTAGNYNVKATARSATNTWALSSASAALTVTAVPVSASLSISKQTFTAGDGYTVWLYTNLPNYNFSFCGSKNGGAWSCSTNTTDSGGNWTTSGWFTNAVAGNWTESVTISLLNQYTVASNGISFSITAATANFSIDSRFYDTDQYTLTVSSNLPNRYFTLCGNQNNQGFHCLPNYAQTDSSGSLSLPGYFSPGADGSWQEYLKFLNPDGSLIVQSNTISFSVVPPPPPWASLSIGGSSFHSTDTYYLVLSSNDPYQSVTLCANFNGSFWGCSSESSTDSSGTWWVSGTFNPSVVGSWDEWATLGDGTQTNRIDFTVNP